MAKLLRTGMTMLTLAAMLSGCGASALPTTGLKARVAAKATAGITVENGGAIALKGTPIALQSEGRRLQQAANVAITYQAQVAPVVVEGETVQANDLLTCGCDGAAFIAYNTQGPTFNGAIQIIDSANPAKPRVLSTIRFPGMDVNALFQEGSTLFFAGQADPDRFGYKAFVGRINLDNPSGEAIMASIRGLRSHAATSLTRQGTSLYVGVGAKDGGVVEVDANFREVSFSPRSDVRALANHGNGLVALAGTTDGPEAQAELKGLAGSQVQLNFPDFASRYGKATLEVNQDLAVLGLGEAGLQLRRLSTGAEAYRLANPSNSPEEATNGASLDGELLFTANGAYGFRVVKVNPKAAFGAGFGSVVGFHRLTGAAYEGKGHSANLVRYRQGQLFVAMGKGGVGLYSLAQ